MTEPAWYEPTPLDELVYAQELLQVEVTEALSAAMEARGVSRAELARRCGITRSALSQRLSGRRSMTLATAAEMFHALGARVRVSVADDPRPRRPAGPAQPTPAEILPVAG